MKKATSLTLASAQATIEAYQQRIEDSTDLDELQSLKEQLSALEKTLGTMGEKYAVYRDEAAMAAAHAARRWGELREKVGKAKGGGDQKSPKARTEKITGARAVPVIPTTKELGMTKRESANASMLAGLGKEKMAAVAADLKTRGKSPTPNAIAKAARAQQDETVRDLYTQGKDRKAIATWLGVKVCQVQRSMARLGLTEKRTGPRPDYMNWLVSELERSVFVLEDCMVAGSLPARQIEGASLAEREQLDAMLSKMRGAALRLRVHARLNKDAAGAES